MIWIVVLGIAAILGSVLMLKPSARDSRLAKLRFDAVKESLKLQQFKWESESKKTGIYDPVTTTSYTLIRPNTHKMGELKWAVVAQKGWDTDHLPAGFSWHKQGSVQQAEQFAELLPQLQDELLVLEVWDNKAMLMAKENHGASALAYKHFLETLMG